MTDVPSVRTSRSPETTLVEAEDVVASVEVAVVALVVVAVEALAVAVEAVAEVTEAVVVEAEVVVAIVDTVVVAVVAEWERIVDAEMDSRGRKWRTRTTWIWTASGRAGGPDRRRLVAGSACVARRHSEPGDAIPGGQSCILQPQFEREGHSPLVLPS